MSLVSLFDITSIVVLDPEVLDSKIFYESLHQQLRLLLLMLMVLTHFQPTTLVHASSVTTQLFLIVQRVYQGSYLTVLFWKIESLIVLYPLMNYSGKPCKGLRLVYQSIVDYVDYMIAQTYANSILVADFNLSTLLGGIFTGRNVFISRGIIFADKPIFNFF